MLTGDVNLEETKANLSNFFSNFDVKSPVKSKNYSKHSMYWSFYTNNICSFQKSTTLAWGSLDFYKMTLTFLKSTFKKWIPKKIFYENYKKFEKDSFENSLRESLQCINHCKTIENIFFDVLNKGAFMYHIGQSHYARQ